MPPKTSARATWSVPPELLRSGTHPTRRRRVSRRPSTAPWAPDFVRALAFSPDGGSLVSGAATAGPTVEPERRQPPGTCVTRKRDHEHRLTADGRSVAWATFYAQVVAFDTTTSKSLTVQRKRTQATPASPLRQGMAFSVEAATSSQASGTASWQCGISRNASTGR